MMQTTAGSVMYNDYMYMASQVLEDTSGTNMADFAELKTMYYYIDQYYTDHGWPTHSFADSMSMCFNSDFSLNLQTDTILSGFTMYDGSNLNAPGIECDDEISWLPLPENSRPTIAEEDNYRYRFNLNPNDNGSLDNKPYRGFANFHSFELFDGESEYIIPDLISPNPPSGRKSIKINNSHILFHVNRLSRTFVADQSTYYYSFASVMENPAGHQYNQPYFTVKLIRPSDGFVLSSRCYVSDINNPFFDWVPTILGKSTAPISYRNWTCDTFNLKPYYGDSLRIDFIASDCAAGGHYGYVYLSDLCVPCSQQPSIQLDSIKQGCLNEVFDINGAMHIDTSSYTILDLYLSIYHNEEVVGTIKDPITLDNTTGDFTFRIDPATYESLPDSTCFDVRALVRVINPEGDTITLTSVTANPNGPTDFDNDFCTSRMGCPMVLIDSFSQECVFKSFEKCGTYSADSTFTLDSIQIQIFHDDTLIATLPGIAEIQDSLYCYRVDYTLLTSLEEDELDIRALAFFRDAQNNSIEVYSSTTIPGKDNDVIYSGCCPTDTIYMDFSSQFCLLGQGSDHQHLVGEGSFILNKLPDGYSICGFLPENFEGATVNYFNYSIYGGIFKYEVGIIIDDWSKLTTDGYFIGNWRLCGDKGDTCTVPVKMRIMMSQMMMCTGGFGQMCMNYSFLGIPPTIYSDGKGNSCTTVKAYFPFDRVYYEEDTCIINSYDVSFYLNTTKSVPLLIDQQTVSSLTYPVLKRLLKNICWPSSMNPYITGITMIFTNNCGDSCNVTQPLSGGYFKDNPEEYRSNPTMRNEILCHPSPASNEVIIKWTNDSKIMSMTIMDLNGHPVFSEAKLTLLSEKD